MKVWIYCMSNNMEPYYAEAPVPDEEVGEGVVIVCSSVLNALLNNGIIKDYQVELRKEGR